MLPFSEEGDKIRIQSELVPVALTHALVVRRDCAEVKVPPAFFSFFNEVCVLGIPKITTLDVIGRPLNEYILVTGDAIPQVEGVLLVLDG